MKIKFMDREFDVIDQTPTHYICPPASNMEGYHYISKSEAAVVIPTTLKEITEIGDAFEQAVSYWDDKKVLNPRITFIINGNQLVLEMSDNDIKIAFISFIQRVAKIAESKYI